MSTGVLTAQVVLVFAVAALGVVSATQWAASALGYQVRLGPPWFVMLGTPIYYPWRLFQWWYFYNAYAPEVFLKGGAMAACSGSIFRLDASAMIAETMLALCTSLFTSRTNVRSIFKTSTGM